MVEQRTENSMLDKLQERCTGMCRPDEFARTPIAFRLQEGAPDGIRPDGLERNEEYELSLTVNVRYWANKVERPYARRNAEAVLARALYDDVLEAISGIKHAIYDGDRRAAIERLEDLQRSITR